jgi:ADP-ribosylglycohydrolase
MLLRYKGCLLGAAIGDAMGMAGEGSPADLWRAECTFRRAYRGHPNQDLLPGQYTDDTQIMLLVAELLAERDFSVGGYAGRLMATYRDGKLRFRMGR